MNLKTYALLAVALFALFAVSGCATSTISAFQKVSPSENSKVTISSLVFTEKNMETKKTPDATEKAVADAVLTSLKENLNRKGLLADRENASFSLDLRVFHYNTTLFGWLSGGGVVRGDPQGLIVRVTLNEKNGSAIVQIDSMDGTGAMRGYRILTTSVSEELSNQIEKILKEGIAVGKTQSP